MTEWFEPFLGNNRFLSVITDLRLPTDSFVCLNPTSFLNDPYKNYFTDNNFSDLQAPYDAYFPVPPEDLLASSFDFKSKTMIDYCLAKLESLVTTSFAYEKNVSLFTSTWVSSTIISLIVIR